MRVARLSIAPVKGLGLLHPDSVEVGPVGVAGDRRFHLADARGRMFNGKRRGELVRVRAEWDAGADALTLTLPDGTVVAGEVALGAPVETRFYGRQRAGRTVVGPWADALSALAGEPVTLIRPGSPGAGQDRAANGAVSLIGAASVAAMGADLDPRRFRMTVTFDGADAFAEDGWVEADVAVGGAVVRVNQHVGRCLVTSQDPDTGVPDRDLLATLRERRPDDLSAPLPLGVAGAIREPGTIRVGDPLSRPAGA